MKYGHFDKSKKEYVIERPDTPLPWINYLGTQDFFGMISRLPVSARGTMGTFDLIARVNPPFLKG